MKTSQLIQLLQQHLEQHGDTAVHVFDADEHRPLHIEWMRVTSSGLQIAGTYDGYEPVSEETAYLYGAGWISVEQETRRANPSQNGRPLIETPS